MIELSIKIHQKIYSNKNIAYITHKNYYMYNYKTNWNHFIKKWINF